MDVDAFKAKAKDKLEEILNVKREKLKEICAKNPKSRPACRDEQILVNRVTKKFWRRFNWPLRMIPLKSRWIINKVKKNCTPDSQEIGCKSPEVLQKKIMLKMQERWLQNVQMHCNRHKFWQGHKEKHFWWKNFANFGDKNSEKIFTPGEQYNSYQMHIMKKNFREKVDTVLEKKRDWCRNNMEEARKWKGWCNKIMGKHGKKMIKARVMHYIIKQHRFKNPMQHIRHWASMPMHFKEKIKKIMMFSKRNNIDVDKMIDKIFDVKELAWKENNKFGKDAYNKFNKSLKYAEQWANTLESYQSYMKERNTWSESNIAKCLHARIENIKKYNENKLNNSQEVKEACDNLASNLPFSNGGCIDKLDEHYYKIQSFINNVSLQDPVNLGSEATDLLKKTMNIFETECLAPMKSLSNTSTECVNYLKKSLIDANIAVNKDQNTSESSGVVEMFLPLKMDYLRKFMFKILSDDFWINAPSDCNLYNNEEVTEEEKNWDSDVDSEENDNENEDDNDNLDPDSWNGEIGTDEKLAWLKPYDTEDIAPTKKVLNEENNEFQSLPEKEGNPTESLKESDIIVDTLYKDQDESKSSTKNNENEEDLFRHLSNIWKLIGKVGLTF